MELEPELEMSIKKVQKDLEVASLEEIYVVGDRLEHVLESHSHELDPLQTLAADILMAIINRELAIRTAEPLWRKAKRFTKRNRGAIGSAGKIAAAVAIGALIGISLDD